MSQVIGDLRELIHQIEQISDEIAKKYDVEHLAGPQGYVLVFLLNTKIKKYLSKILKNNFVSQSQLLVI